MKREPQSLTMHLRHSAHRIHRAAWMIDSGAAALHCGRVLALTRRSTGKIRKLFFSDAMALEAKATVLRRKLSATDRQQAIRTERFGAEIEKLGEMARRLRAKLENWFVKIKRYHGERRGGREEESRIQKENPAGASIFVADHLRPAAKKTGVDIEDGQRFGLHNLRHSLSNWLVNKAKVEPKTVQGILRHAKIQTTLDLHTQDDGDETRAAHGEYLTALGVATQIVQ
jgi:hypothetical protein